MENCFVQSSPGKLQETIILLVSCVLHILKSECEAPSGILHQEYCYAFPWNPVQCLTIRFHSRNYLRKVKSEAQTLLIAALCAAARRGCAASFTAKRVDACDPFGFGFVKSTLRFASAHFPQYYGHLKSCFGYCFACVV
jgi:hypothetical protein